MRLIDADALITALCEQEIELAKHGIMLVKGEHNLFNIIKEQPTVNEWIPVSERLPEEEKQYLCVVDRFIFDSKEKCREHYYKICRYAKDLYSVDKYDFMHKKGVNGFYVYDSEYGYLSVNDIIAWMPIPEYE